MKVRLRDHSGSRIYRYIFQDFDRHGNLRTYFRRKGQPKVRLTEAPGTAAFEAEYQRAFRGFSQSPSATRAAAAQGTLALRVRSVVATALTAATTGGTS